MSPLEALQEMVEYLEEVGVSYAVIGGLAAAVWGLPRETRDADLTVSVPAHELEPFLAGLFSRFRPRLEDARAFALRTHVALVQSARGMPIDVALAYPGYQELMVGRAATMDLTPGFRSRVCSPEDLIVLKAVASRSQDERDISAVLDRRGPTLDLAYIRHWLAEFDAASGEERYLPLFERLLHRH